MKTKKKSRNERRANLTFSLNVRRWIYSVFFADFLNFPKYQQTSFRRQVGSIASAPVRLIYFFRLFITQRVRIGTQRVNTVHNFHCITKNFHRATRKSLDRNASASLRIHGGANEIISILKMAINRHGTAETSSDTQMSNAHTFFSPSHHLTETEINRSRRSKRGATLMRVFSSRVLFQGNADAIMWKWNEWK